MEKKQKSKVFFEIDPRTLKKTQLIRITHHKNDDVQSKKNERSYSTWIEGDKESIIGFEIEGKKGRNGKRLKKRKGEKANKRSRKAKRDRRSEGEKRTKKKVMERYKLECYQMSLIRLDCCQNKHKSPRLTFYHQGQMLNWYQQN